MKISVWDTYVQREDGRRMHFDILVPSDLKDEPTIFVFGNAYLKTKSVENHTLTTKECRFCHIEHASKEIVEAIDKNGYAIIEMENCD
ncbi:DUF2024 family protein [Muriicola sp. E247]|uniref:DUF2024 family protein n=1 Tax=unclassified Muriicola TaxID=2647561 RepID=UPI00350F1624